MRDPDAPALPSLLPVTATGLVYETEGQRLVDIETLTVDEGGPSVILGPNGAGKSMLLRLLHGLIPPSRGSVRFNGSPADNNLRRRQAMVFQRPVLLRRSVAANIDFALKAHQVPRKNRQTRTALLLEQAALADKARQPARTLSGGEQQRLALVRALATAPGILFLDEPTANLYPGAIRSFEALVQQAAMGGTKIIMVTQDVAQARRLASEVLFMHRGAILEQSPADNFFDNPASAAARAFLEGDLLL